jgi:hypothetical protein
MTGTVALPVVGFVIHETITGFQMPMFVTTDIAPVIDARSAPELSTIVIGGLTPSLIIKVAVPAGTFGFGPARQGTTMAAPSVMLHISLFMFCFLFFRFRDLALPKVCSIRSHAPGALNRVLPILYHGFY